MPVKEYHVVGRKAPTEAEPSPPIYRMRLFAPNEVVAKSRYWYFMHQIQKMKKSTGDILAVSEVRSAARARPPPPRLSLAFLALPPPYRRPAAPPCPSRAPLQIRERNTNIVKNYGITIRYNSRSGTHNMYKEFRAVSLCSAVDQMYSELAGRHRARFHAIQIVDTRIVPAGVRAANRYNPEKDGDEVPPAVKRPSIKQCVRSQRAPSARRGAASARPLYNPPSPPAPLLLCICRFLDGGIQFPLPHRIVRPATKALRSTFNARRPTTFFH